jgi:2-amino-4-hydroxy-6-hydroxymethyldihydropteridine diphosphokinase
VILIAIGANLPALDGAPPAETCRRAALALADLPGLTLEAVSRWYESAPIPPGPQPRYVNGAVRLRGHAEPAGLLAMLQAIEARAGRLRGEPNAPRSLDLDIIDMCGKLRDAPDPVLPHPRAHLRAFVLVPLRDVAPGWVHPRLGRRADDLLRALPPQDIRPLAEPGGAPAA